MYHDTRVYDLSFVSPQKRPPTKPQLVFTLERKYLEPLIGRLKLLDQLMDVEAYLGANENFSFPSPDLFGNTEFGYGRCGFCKETEDEIALHIELSEPHLHRATLTVCVLTRALLGDLAGKEEASNHQQQVDLETCCTKGAHGHSVGGYISGSIREWLRKQWQKGPVDNWMQWAPMPQEVVTAMRQAWSAITSQTLQPYAQDCSGAITEDGRFILNCFGNACDLAIYPDSLALDAHSSVRFSCHNLDSAMQQLTLLAGLAKLCELVRSEKT